MSAPAIEAALLADNRERCVPPLPEAEARAAAASVAKYEPARPDEARRANAEGVSRHLVSMTAENLLALPRQPREYVLEPFMRTKDTGMIAAERGVGKTWVSMGMASAIAAGGRFLDWTAPRPRPVLYVDGELPTETIQERLRQTREICGHDWEGRLAFLAADLQESSIPSLNSPEAQLMIEEHLGAAEVLFLDNLSCLCRGGVENEAESWEGMQAWILSLRRRGVAVFFDHHAGRSGKPRGTSKREDVLDIVISLKHPDDYVPEQGARFEVHFDKARGLYGTAVAAFEARLDIGGSLSPLKWVTRSLEGVLKERVLALHRDGMKQNDIAKAVERDKSRVSRILTKAKAAGEITPCP
jgi:putative DNA primase/helicase